MKLMEYQAKSLFAEFGVPTQDRAVLLTETQDVPGQVRAAGLAYPLVMKAQVPAGGRGKAGGVRFAKTPDEAQAVADALLFADLNGHRVNALLVHEKIEIADEWYLAILLDCDLRAPLVIFSTKGGMDIERVAAETPDALARVPVNPLVGVTGYLVEYLCSRCGVAPEMAPGLRALLEKLYAMFCACHCLVAEVNPLAVTPQNELVAVDGKVEADDDALFCLPRLRAWRDEMPEHPLVLEARGNGFLYIPLPAGGRTAVMSNGSGMLMSMIDLLAKEGVSAACALDLGGGATSERIARAVHTVLKTDGVDTLFICIFGGITRCDEVAEGVCRAMADAGAGKRVVIRMEGTNREAGVRLVSRLPGAMPVGGIVEGVRAVAQGVEA